MKYQIILFDLDDTLIDFSYSEQMGLKNIHNKFYSTIEYSVFECLYKEINTKLWEQVSIKKNPLMPSDVRLLRFKQLNDELSCTVSAEEIANEYDINLYVHARWFPNVQKTIEFLYQKGHILGIITNGFISVQGEKHKRLALHNWFDCYIISDEVGVAKPDVEIFDIAINEIANKRRQPVQSYSKNSMLMVGDSIISDGYGAQNFGISYCFINNKAINILPSGLPITYNISSVSHLPSCIGYEERIPYL